MPLEEAMQRGAGQARNRRLQGIEAIIEGQQGPLAKRDNQRFLGGRQDGRMGGLRPHRRVVDDLALLPLSDGFRVDPVTLAQGLDRSLRSLYCRSDGVSGRGAAVKNLSHRASLLMVASWITPSHPGTKHLGCM